MLQLILVINLKKQHIIIFIFAVLIISVGLFFILKNDIWFFNHKKKDNKINPTEKFSYTPIMYKICDDNNCNYLVGSMHLGDAHINDFSDKTINAYKEMKKLAVETDITEAALNLDDFLLPNGTTIDTLISEELNKKLEEFSREHTLFSYEQYKSYKLGFVMDVLASVAYYELGYMTAGADTYFLNLAHNENKKIISIEQLEEQFKFLTDYSDDLYEFLIEQTIDTYDSAKESIKKLYKAYLDGNGEELKKLLFEDEYETEIPDDLKEEMEKYQADLSANRNLIMADAIENYLALDEDVFVVVGAAHVVADDGIVEILKEKGYEITQMN